jgi:hypothetical protein
MGPSENRLNPVKVSQNKSFFLLVDFFQVFCHSNKKSLTQEWIKNISIYFYHYHRSKSYVEA